MSIYLNWGCAFIAVVVLAVLIDRKLAHAALSFYMIFYEEGRRLKCGRTSGVIDFYLIGVFGTVLLLRLLAWVHPLRIQADGMVARTVRYIAEGTFAIYLVHFPLFVLIAATIPYNHRSLWQKALILFALLAFGVLMGQACRVFKTKLRSIALRPAGRPLATPSG
jgi:peptidoglycan/LPS O-acetylase OafA/YrhL